MDSTVIQKKEKIKEKIDEIKNIRDSSNPP